jgi:hypothetical protein
LQVSGNGAIIEAKIVATEISGSYNNFHECRTINATSGILFDFKRFIQPDEDPNQAGPRDSRGAQRLENFFEK